VLNRDTRAEVCARGRGVYCSLCAGVPVTGLELRQGVASHAVGRGLHHAEQVNLNTEP